MFCLPFLPVSFESLLLKVLRGVLLLQAHQAYDRLRKIITILKVYFEYPSLPWSTCQSENPKSRLPSHQFWDFSHLTIAAPAPSSSPNLAEDRHEINIILYAAENHPESDSRINSATCSKHEPTLV